MLRRRRAAPSVHAWRRPWIRPAPLPAPGSTRSTRVASTRRSPRPAPRALPTRTVLDALARHDLVVLRERVRSDAAALGLDFGPGRPLAVDPVPRADRRAPSGSALEAGLLQRARALNAFLARRLRRPADLRRRRGAAAPARDLAGYEPRMRGLLDPAVPPATVAGLDLVRDADGALLVLEDNLRMPSGADLRRRRARSGRAGARRRASEPRAARRLRRARSARRSAPPPPTARADPAAAIVSDGPASGAWYEHRRLGRELGIPVVTPGELEVERGRLFARHDRDAPPARRPLPPPRRGPPQRARRRPDRARRAAAAGAASRAGCAASTPSAPASPTTSSPTPTSRSMVRFYLGEEPLLRSVPSFDLADRGGREAALERLDELVIKPRDGFGGHGRDDHAARDRAAAAARDRAGAAAPGAASSPRRRCSSPPTRPSAAAGCGRAGSTCGRSSSAPATGSDGDARRPDPLRPRRRRDGRQQLARRRLQGHLGDRAAEAAMKRRSLASRRERPLIGVTTSEVRRAERVDADARGRAAAAARWRSACPTCAAIEAAGGAAGGDAAARARTRSSRCSTGSTGSASPAAPTSTRPTTAPSPHPELGPTEPDLDRFELAVARRADARDMPILAICRGTQALNVVRGGTLLQHLPEHLRREIAHRQRDARRPDQPRGRRSSPAAGWRRRSAPSARSTSTPSTTRRSTGSARACVVSARAPDGTIEGGRGPEPRAS